MTRKLPDSYTEYLRDESKLEGHASGISFPESDAEIRDIIRDLSRQGTPATVQGSRTGLVGGAVPAGGHILNLSRMKKTDPLIHRDDGQVSVFTEAGATLASLRSHILSESDGRYGFMPDPTETTASIGGMIACNASGARSLKYGSVRGHVLSLDLVFADGSGATLTKDTEKASGRRFRICSDSGNVYSGSLPSYILPDVKNSAGYHVRENMDLVSLFTGSEGTLAVISGAELLLMPSMPYVWGMLCFFETEEDAALFSQAAKQVHSGKIAAIEYLNADSLMLAGELHSQNKMLAAIYIELESKDENTLAYITEQLDALSETYGADSDRTLLATDTRNMDRLKEIRHAVPEAINRLVAEAARTFPGITKLASDFSVPEARLADAMRMYRSGIIEAGVRSAVFGHIGSGHLHVNLIPQNMEKYDLCKEMLRRWASQIIPWGGSVSAEHGTGKLKKDYLRMMYKESGIEQMKALKRVFDPVSMLNRGCMFD